MVAIANTGQKLLAKLQPQLQHRQQLPLVQADADLCLLPISFFASNDIKALVLCHEDSHTLDAFACRPYKLGDALQTAIMNVSS